MSDPVLIATITVLGGGLIGVWVELIRNRRAEKKVVTQTEELPQVARTVVKELTTNSGSSTYDIVREMRDDLKTIKKDVGTHSERLARVETGLDGMKTRLEDHLRTGK